MSLQRLAIKVGISLAAWLATLGPARADAGVPVLIYHEVGNEAKAPGETVISLEKFAQQMRYLAEHGFTTISVDELVRYMRFGGRLPPRPIVLTFDDGWKNVLNAVPVLDRHGFKASFWIVSGKGIGGEYMEWDDIERLDRHPGFEVHSHTVSHPWDETDNLVTWVEGKVPGKGEREARAELAGARFELERRLHRLQRYLAWPCGWYNDRLIELAREEGYLALFTAEAGLNSTGGDILRIKRTFVDGACSLEDFALTVRDGRYRVCQARGRPTSGHLPIPPP